MRITIPCVICGKDLGALNIQYHYERNHDSYNKEVVKAQVEIQKANSEKP